MNRCGSIPQLAELDHNIVFVELNIRAELPKKQPLPQHNFHKANWENMKNKLTDLNIPTGNIQEMWDYFENLIQEHGKIHTNSMFETKQPNAMGNLRFKVTL